MFHKFKKQLPKLYTHISTALVVLVLFMLQFVAIDGNLEFYKYSEFWFSLAIMLAILIVINEIYWRNGSSRGELNDKYISSSIEYSIRVNKIKNNNPSLTDDFYKYIDELNIQLYIEARNDFLDAHRISRNDYYCGHPTYIVDNQGQQIAQYSTPHCELSRKELLSLTKTDINGDVIPYYTTRQVNAILQAVYGEFKYEKQDAAEILSGTKFKNTKFATHYNSKQNKRNFASSSAVVSTAVSVIAAMFGTSLVRDGWDPAALFVFLYRLAMVVWRAIMSDEAGYNDIVEITKAVNINRSNVLTMYTRNREIDAIYENIDSEISEAQQTLYQMSKETTEHGRRY